MIRVIVGANKTTALLSVVSAVLLCSQRINKLGPYTRTVDDSFFYSNIGILCTTIPSFRHPLQPCTAAILTPPPPPPTPPLPLTLPLTIWNKKSSKMPFESRGSTSGTGWNTLLGKSLKRSSSVPGAFTSEPWKWTTVTRLVVARRWNNELIETKKVCAVL